LNARRTAKSFAVRGAFSYREKKGKKEVTANTFEGNGYIIRREKTWNI